MKIKFTILFTLSLVSITIGCNYEKTQNYNSFKDTDIVDLLSLGKEKFPSYNSNYPPPIGEREMFSLSQDYPKTYKKENYPWQQIDFMKQPFDYMQTILEYCLEGNVEVNFKGQENKVRKWYHAPWLHDDGKYSSVGEYIGNGREYIHGLTRELATPKFKIHEKQDKELENWAVGMYNSPGGYILGKVWNSPKDKPNPQNTNFPEGTVSFKLLFTDGDTNTIPFLAGTLEWEANIYLCNPKSSLCANKKRVNRKVKLLQVDFAVKDCRAKNTGWVFGTFIYDSSLKGKTVWDKLSPVGLSWGDDPHVTKDLNKDGAFVNRELNESYLNESLINKSNKGAYVLYHGLGGRLNGPVDNVLSSCISCHGQAAVTDQGLTLPLGNFENGTNRLNYPITSFNQFFTNVPSGSNNRTFNGQNYLSTDYSLQISAGIRNYYNNLLIVDQILNKSSIDKKELRYFTKKDVKEIYHFSKGLPEVTRGEN